MFLKVLTAPLEALCDFQIQHGAVEHQSREFKIAHGLWQKKLPKKMIKRMEKEREAMIEAEKSNGVEDGDS